jgi:hypothetical protein
MPDFGVTASKEKLYAGVDVAELAARLGALPRYDRLGDVVYLEDFEGGLSAWEAETSGASAAVEWVCDRHVTGHFACKLTAGSDASRYAGIKGRFPVPFSVVYGIEICWTLHDDMDYAIVQADVYTGVYRISFGIKYDQTTLSDYYLNAAGGWTQILPQIVPYMSDRNFINTKFTFDISTQKYKRLLVTPVAYDVADKGGLIAASAERPRMEAWGRIYSTSGNNAYSYVDSLILTANDV